MKKLLLSSALIASGIVVNAQWVSQATGFAAPSRGITNISIVDPSIVWASAYDGSGGTAKIQEFTRTIDGGANWTPGFINNASQLEISNLFAISADIAWVSMHGGNSGGGRILKTTDGGLNWVHQTTATFTAPVGFPNVVYFFDEDNGVALGDPRGGYYEFYTTTNGGDLWTRVPSLNIPAPSSANEYGIVNRYSVVGNTIWYGTNEGRVYKSVDMGYTWTVAATGLSEISRVIFKDADNGLFIDGVDIASSSDGGATWSPLFYSGDFLEGDIAYATGVTGSMYISTSAAQGASGSSYSLDDGLTWTLIDGIQHTCVAFYDNLTGWSGSFNTNSTENGILVWNEVALGVITAQNDKAIGFYPNPNNGVFSISLKGKQSGQTTVTVFDVMGRNIYSSSENYAGDSFVKTMDISSFPGGVYFVEVKDATQTYTGKIVKQ